MNKNKIIPRKIITSINELIIIIRKCIRDINKTYIKRNSKTIITLIEKWDA